MVIIKVIVREEGLGKEQVINIGCKLSLRKIYDFFISFLGKRRKILLIVLVDRYMCQLEFLVVIIENYFS